MPPVRNSIDRPDNPPRARPWAWLASVRRIGPRRLRLRRPRTSRRHHGTLASLAGVAASTCAGERRAAVPAEVAVRAVRRAALAARHVAGAGRRLDPDRLGGDGLGRGCRGARRRRRRPAPGSSAAAVEARPRRRLGAGAVPPARGRRRRDATAVAAGRRAVRRRWRRGVRRSRSPSNSRNAPHTQNSVPSGWRRLHLRQTITASRRLADGQRLARAHDAMGHLPRLLDQQRVLGDGTPPPDRRHGGAADVVGQAVGGRPRRWRGSAPSSPSTCRASHAVVAEAHGARPQLRQQAGSRRARGPRSRCP